MTVTVIGSYVVDLMSRTPYMPKPGETVLGGPFQSGHGGKGSNQATAAARQGIKVNMVTKIGSDVFGEQALKHFSKENINADFIVKSVEEATGAALIAVDSNGENMIIVAIGASGKLTKEEVRRAEEKIKLSTVILLQLETSLEANEEAIRLGKKHAVPIILNPAPYYEFPKHWLKDVTFLTPNETEAEGLTGIPIQDEASARKAGESLYQQGVKNVVITLGSKGCLLYNGQQKGVLIPGFSVEVVDTTGAGDAFNGGLAACLDQQKSLVDSLTYANAVGALSVTRVGTAASMPTRQEVDHFLNRK